MTLSILSPTGWHEVTGPGRWFRPAHWLPITVTPGEQKIQILVEVGLPSHPDTARQMTVLAIGAYTVDWGDGSPPENYASNTAGLHQYSGEGLTALGPVSSQAMVTITPQSGNLTTLNLSMPFVTGKTWRSPTLEVVLGPSTIISTVYGNATNIEHIAFLSPVTVTSVLNMFQNLYNVRQIEGSITCNATTGQGMFTGCAVLGEFPSVSLPNATNMTGYMQNCYAVAELPPHNIDFNKVTNWSSAFSACYALKETPPEWAFKGTTFTSMFSGCTSLKKVASFDATAATALGSTFSSCFILEEIPPIQPTNCVTWTSTFSGCYRLRNVTTNMAGVTNANACFQNCASLVSIDGTLDWSAVSSAANMTNTFSACASLRKLQFAAGKGPRFNWTAVGMLDATTLNQIYTDLPTITGQTITRTSCPGSTTDNPSIATAKGWTVA